MADSERAGHGFLQGRQRKTRAYVPRKRAADATKNPLWKTAKRELKFCVEIVSFQDTKTYLNTSQLSLRRFWSQKVEEEEEEEEEGCSAHDNSAVVSIDSSCTKGKHHSKRSEPREQ